MNSHTSKLPDALTRGVSLFLTRTMIVIRVRTIPREDKQMGKMAKTELQDIYWICRKSKIKLKSVKWPHIFSFTSISKQEDLLLFGQRPTPQSVQVYSFSMYS